MARPQRSDSNASARSVRQMQPGEVSKHGNASAPIDPPSERRHGDRPEPQRRTLEHTASSSRGSALATTAFSVAILVGLIFGAVEVSERQITPKDGLGYYLGIVGGVMMLGLLLYPARKHYKWMQWGTVAGWFQAHMVLGVVGPALIVIHSGFEMNSKNAAVAMIAMLLVVASGIIGRYVYARLHFGLYGRRAEVQELIKDVELAEAALALGSALPDQMIAELRALADGALGDTRTLAGCLRFRASRGKRRSIKRALHTDMETSIAAAALHSRAEPAVLRLELDKAHATLDSLFFTVEQIGSVRFYERAFNAWHLLHLPLYYLLMVSAVLHVLAVHMY